MPGTLHTLSHAFLITTKAGVIPSSRVRAMRLTEAKCLSKVLRRASLWWSLEVTV